VPLASNIFGEDFLEKIVAVHFPGGGPPPPTRSGPFVVIYFVRFHDKGPAFDTQTSFTPTSTTSFKMPISRGIVDPFPAYNIPGVGAPPPAIGAPPPITNTFSKAMLKVYDSWIGQDKDIKDTGTPADRDHEGYMVLNLGKANVGSLVTFNLLHNNSGVPLSGGYSFFIATFRKATSVNYLNAFIPPSAFDGVLIGGTPAGTSFMGYDTEGDIETPPIGSLDYAFRENLSAPTGAIPYVCAIDPETGSISLTG